MKKIWMRFCYDIRKMQWMPGYMLTFLMAVLVISILPSAHSINATPENVFLLLLGGPAFEELLSMHEIIRWILILLPFAVGIMIPMQREYEGQCKTSLLYFGTYRSWYLSKVVSAFITVLLLCLTLTAGIWAGTKMWHVNAHTGFIKDAEGFSIPVLPCCVYTFFSFFSGVLAITYFQMLVHLITGSSAAAIFAFLIPLIVGIYSYSNVLDDPAPLYHPVNWMMFSRSEILSAPGWNLNRGFIGLGILSALFAAAGILICPKIQIASRNNE